MNKNLERRVIGIESGRLARTKKGLTHYELTILLTDRFLAYECRELELAKMTPDRRAAVLRTELEARRDQWAEETARPSTAAPSGNTHALETRAQQELKLRILEAEGVPAAIIESKREAYNQRFRWGARHIGL